MLYYLAGYTLCRRYHQNQATEVSNRWFGMVQSRRDDGDDRASDTSDDGDDEDSSSSSSSSGSDDSNDNDNTALPLANDNPQELRRRFDELETLQREFEELLQRQREIFHSYMPSSHLSAPRQHPRVGRQQDSISKDTSRRRKFEREAEQTREENAYLAAQREREAAREQLRRDRAEQARLTEAQRQAEREKEAKAESESERVAKAQAEKARLDQERQANEKRKQESHVSSWESAWSRYESAWVELSRDNAAIHSDICSSLIWPTKSGSLASCCEEDVGAFFRCQPGDVSRRMLRRQALR
jgi:DNA repair exonuclease SbcCD ATPase subunit